MELEYERVARLGAAIESIARFGRTRAHEIRDHLHGLPPSEIIRYSQCFARWPTSHRQHDAELSVTAHHARVGLGRLFERIGFNHGTHAT
jgi:hypothetical protein